MKKLAIVVCILLNGLPCFSQSAITTDKNVLPAYYVPGQKIDFFNANSPYFIRILDGLQLKKNDTIPANINVSFLERLSDSVAFRKLGLPASGKPYMIFNTHVTTLRQYIYSKAGIGQRVRNLPVILNDTLITPEQYSQLDNLDSSRILTVQFLKVVPDRYSRQFQMPLGAIKVFSRSE